MKTMKWLLLREFWENKGSMLKAPLAVGGVMLLISLISLGNMYISINGHSGMRPAMAIEAYNRLGVIAQSGVVTIVANTYIATAAPILIMMPFVIFMYCLNCLYDERRDRSILFWKSLPISDRDTVLSKFAMALLVAPLLFISIAAALALLQMLLFCIYAAIGGQNFFLIVFARPPFYLSLLRVLALLPVYIVWAMPTVAWLILVSAWARSKVFLWAVGMPLMAGVMLKWAGRLLSLDLDTSWFWSQVVVRGLLGLVPGIWFKLDTGMLSQFAPASDDFLPMLVQQSWETLNAAEVWIAVAASAAMIWLAISLRARQDGT